MKSFGIVNVCSLFSFYVAFSCHYGFRVMAWENAEFEMFDLVEEVGVGVNFYEVLGISQDASFKEIKQAYRKLSVKLHPDKNDAPDADVQFRQLVGMYEVLKDDALRKSYNQVLIDGLPNWRNPIFYYRRVRKLALWQVAVIVLTIVSVGQYLAGWAAYWEKKLSVQEMMETRLRRTQRTRKAQKEGPSADDVAAEIEKHLQRPSLWDIAPIQLCRLAKYMVCNLPWELMAYMNELKEQREEEEKQKALIQSLIEQEKQSIEETKKPRKRKTFKIPEKAEIEDSLVPTSWTNEASEDKKPNKRQLVSGGLWTDDDIAELTKLCSKFPGGTPDRWEKISENLCRPVAEVTFMAKKVLEKLTSRQGEEVAEQPQVKLKVKTKGGKLDSLSIDSVINWSSEEQKALEHALQLYPKGAIERWDKISNMVPGRSKDECLQRFKYLAELVKKKKEKVEEEQVAVKESSDAVENIGNVDGIEAAQSSNSEVKSTQNLKEPSLRLNAGCGGGENKNSQRSKKDTVERQNSSSSSNSTSDSDWCVIDNPRPP